MLYANIKPIGIMIITTSNNQDMKSDVGFLIIDPKKVAVSALSITGIALNRGLAGAFIYFTTID